MVDVYGRYIMTYRSTYLINELGEHDLSTITACWFGTFFIFSYIGNNNPIWLSHFSEGLKPPTRLTSSWNIYHKPNRIQPLFSNRRAFRFTASSRFVFFGATLQGKSSKKNLELGDHRILENSWILFMENSWDDGWCSACSRLRWLRWEISRFLKSWGIPSWWIHKHHGFII